jgi:hypothetical protein
MACDFLSYRFSGTTGIQDSWIRDVPTVTTVEDKENIARWRVDGHLDDLFHRHTPIISRRIESAEVAPNRRQDSVSGEVKQHLTLKIFEECPAHCAEGSTGDRSSVFHSVKQESTFVVRSAIHMSLEPLAHSFGVCDAPGQIRCLFI